MIARLAIGILVLVASCARATFSSQEESWDGFFSLALAPGCWFGPGTDYPQYAYVGAPENSLNDQGEPTRVCRVVSRQDDNSPIVFEVGPDAIENGVAGFNILEFKPSPKKLTQILDDFDLWLAGKRFCV